MPLTTSRLRRGRRAASRALAALLLSRPCAASCGLGQPPSDEEIARGVARINDDWTDLDYAGVRRVRPGDARR